MHNKKLRKTAEKILQNMELLENLTDKELKAKTEEFRVRIKNGETLEKILPEVYAVVGEAAYRTIGMKPYLVQMMGATALHYGNVVEQHTGEGKAVTLDTKIPTPAGWKTAGEIRVGDLLFGRDGKPTKVTGVYPQGKRKVYEVYLADWRMVKTAADHLWSVCRGKELYNTKEIIERIWRGETVYIPTNQPVEYAAAKDLQIPPYEMGITIAQQGDGIPLAYKIASISQRWELIRGLFDAGAYTHGGLFFATASSLLAKDISEVLRSLGVRCTVAKDLANKVSVCEGNAHEFFKEKTTSVKLPPARDRIGVRMVIEKDTMEEMVCFTVDNPEHLFLCGDYIVTHNTLVAAMPSYLNALEGKGVHVVTVNDYLAERDAKDIGRIHEFLGLSVGCVLRTTSPVDKKKEYAKDITYVTNTELGFDYLRDNMAKTAEERVQRGYHYCIIDEVDSILIDEARTPLIIAGEEGKSTKLYVACNELAKMLKKGAASEVSKVDIIAGERAQESGDYIVDEEHNTVTLTLQGIQACEKYFGIENLSDRNHTEMYHNIIAALRAHNLMKKDKDYVVRDGEVIIVDAFTGRLQPGRRFTDGLHQAIEAKEGVRIHDENMTFATVTYQNFFNKYEKKCGMTGTACTEKKEFWETYHMHVTRIPTNRPEIRDDLHDRLFLDRKTKFESVIKEVESAYQKGQPVLVGTSTIQDSEILDKMLDAADIPHTVLNAKFPEKEAKIIAEAGKYKAVTIATNMAGRGTDIKLDNKAKEVGGLFVIGTQRHESRRIDNQLRGRSGRQGDPGKSIFMASLDDEVLRLYGQERMKKVLMATGLGEEGLENRMVERFIKKAQVVIEDNNFGARKNVLKFDQINNEQRELIYKDRNAILDKADTRDTMLNMIHDVVNMTADKFLSKYVDEDEYEDFSRELEVLVKGIRIPEFSYGTTKKEMAKQCANAAEAQYFEREREWADQDMFREFERQILLRCIDIRWMQHINDLEILRQNISLVGYGQKDPIMIYKMKAFTMFRTMSDMIKKDAVSALFASRLRAQ